MLSILVFLFLFNHSAVDDINLEHEFHLSKCDVDYNLEEAALQISISMFIDDLELTLEGLGYHDLKICSKDESPEAEEIILEYLQNHLLIKVDNADVQLNWVGKEISEDLAAVWSYLEVINVRPSESIFIQNDVLMEGFDDQQNVVKLEFDKSRKSFFLFNKGDFSGVLNL